MDPKMRRWIEAKPRSRSECVSRWGHIFQDAEDRGEIATSDRRVEMVGRFRSLTDTVTVKEG